MRTDLWDIARGPRTPLDLDRVRRRAGAPARRRRAIAVVLVIALVGVYGLSTTVTRRSTSEPTTTVPPTVTPFTMHAARGLDDVVVLAAPVSAASHGALARVELGTGRFSRYDTSTSLDVPSSMLVAGDRVLWLLLDHAFSMPVTLEGPGVDIGRATGIVPTGDDRFVWLVEARRRYAVKVAVDGGLELGPHVPLAEGEIVTGAVDDGIVVELDQHLAIADGAGGRRSLGDGHVIAGFRGGLVTSAGTVIDVDGQVTQLSSFPSDVRGAAFSTDGRYIATWSGEPGSRQAGVSIHDARSGSRIRFHRFQSIAGISGEQLVWSRSNDAVYFLARDTDDAAASRLIGFTLYGSPETLVTFNEDGWRWLVTVSR